MFDGLFSFTFPIHKLDFFSFFFWGGNLGIIAEYNSPLLLKEGWHDKGVTGWLINMFCIFVIECNPEN